MKVFLALLVIGVLLLSGCTEQSQNVGQQGDDAKTSDPGSSDSDKGSIVTGFEVEASSNAGVSGEEEKFVDVLILGGEHYPKYQFHIYNSPEDACGAPHWHADFIVFSLEGSSTVDPNPTGCGFGKVGEVKEEKVKISSLGANTISIAYFESQLNTGDNPRDTPPPEIYGEELDSPLRCGPDITGELVDSLNRIQTRAFSLSSADKGPVDGAFFLNRNGINIDFSVTSAKDSAGNTICPTPECVSPDGQSTVTLCGVCVLEHNANDILYGFISNQLDVPFSIQLFGAHYAQYVSYDGLDPLSSQASYKIGNDASEGSVPLTVGDFCDIAHKSTLKIGIFNSPASFEILSKEQPFLSSCSRCSQTPGRVIKDFSKLGWT